MNDKLTQKDIDKMEAEIEHRKLVIRKEALEAVKEARAQGDLSENFEYYAAKKYKNQNESRIRYLEKMIKTAEIIEDDTQEDEIGLNKTVEVEFVEDQTVETYRLVTTVRNNPLQGLVSIDSPIGKSLIGHKTGETVHVQVNKDFGYDVIVKSVINTPDDDSIELRKF
jgi:transcription elongation factor GreA